MSTDHLGNCINTKLNQQLDKLKIKIEWLYEVLTLCKIMLFSSWGVILIIVYLLYNENSKYKTLHNQAIEYGWIDSDKNPQIKLDQSPFLVSSEENQPPLSIHYCGKVLDPFQGKGNTWHKFRIIIEPKWEAP